MRRIQAVAMGLFEQHGFREITVEDIAARAEVSPSSVYRYFETKEGIVLWDEGMDYSFLIEFGERAALSSPREAFQETLQSFMFTEYDNGQSRLLRQFRLAMEVPELRQATQAQFLELQHELVRKLGQSLNRPTTDLRINVISGAVMGAFLAAAEVWSAKDGQPEFAELLEQTMEILSEPLDW